MEELIIKVDIGNTKLIISNIYIPPASSCSNGYQSSIEHLLTTPDTLILGDFNAHHPSWYSRSTDTRGKRMDDSINRSYFGILNCRPISLLCPAVKVLESLILPTINKYLQPAPDQHDFRPDHSTISSLLQMTTDVTMGFNQRKPPDQTICIAVDLLAAFDTVCRNNLLSKINRSQLPPATARWLSCYLRGRQAETCFRGVKLTSRKVNTGVPQGSKLSPSLFSF